MSTSTDLPLVNLSTGAVQRLCDLIAKDGDLGLMLRVYVTGGGCSGFQYGFQFDKNQNDDDFIFEQAAVSPLSEYIDTFSVLIDAMSFQYLQGAEIDFVEGLQGAHFTVKNPNTETTCGCGSSFSVKDD